MGLCLGMCVWLCVWDASSIACTFIAQIFIKNIYNIYSFKPAKRKKSQNEYIVLLMWFCSSCFLLFTQTDTPSITAKLINEQKEDKEKKNHEEKEKMKADSGFQDNYSVVVASGSWFSSLHTPYPIATQPSSN